MKKYKRFYIEITNICNLQCSFCLPTRRTPKYMTVASFKKILDQIKGYTDYLYFHVKGEPLLHPDLGGFLQISGAKGFQVNITTNGTLIQKVKKHLSNKPALRQISFSLQSFEDQDDLLAQEKYLHDVLTFTKEANQQSDIIIELRLWNLDLKNQAKSIGSKNAYTLDMISKYLQLPFQIEEKISLGKGIKLAERIYLSQAYEFDWPDLEKEDISEKGFCYGLRNQIAVLVDGTVIPCCLDSEGVIKLGNIHDTEFKDIIESERAKNILNGFSNRVAVEPLCRKCGYRERFDI